METEQTINIDPRKLFNIGVNLIIAGFIKQNSSDAKKLFKQLKQGETLKGGQLKSDKTGEVIPIKFETEVRKDKELKTLRTLTNQDTGEVLFNIPSGVQIDGDINVLMMAVKPESDCIIVKLAFMEPEPFLVETPQD